MIELNSLKPLLAGLRLTSIGMKNGILVAVLAVIMRNIFLFE